MATLIGSVGLLHMISSLPPSAHVADAPASSGPPDGGTGSRTVPAEAVVAAKAMPAATSSETILRM
jgi:hypothetical protein